MKRILLGLIPLLFATRAEAIPNSFFGNGNGNVIPIIPAFPRFNADLTKDFLTADNWKRQEFPGPWRNEPSLEGETIRRMEALPLVFEETFSRGADRWEPTDPAAWTLGKDGDRAVWGLNKRKSNYEPKVRSPHNAALVKDLELTDTVITFQVKSTLDTGGHRDCCVFFNWRDPEHFYYVHLGAKPDSASGQIMIVDGAPRRPLTKNTRPVRWDDQWHTVKLARDVTTGRIAVYFDDLETPLMEATDTTFTSGRVGIGSFDDMNDFTQVKVSGRKAEAGGQ
jgi:hypothetical protein